MRSIRNVLFLILTVAAGLGLGLGLRAEEEEGAGSYHAASEVIAASEPCQDAWESGDGLEFTDSIVEEESSGAPGGSGKTGSSNKPAITLYITNLTTGEPLLTLTINGATNNPKKVTARTIYRGLARLMRTTVGGTGPGSVNTQFANIQGSFDHGNMHGILVRARPLVN